MKKSRNPEYQEFLDIRSGRKSDSYPKNQEEPLTGNEVGWERQYQFRRMIGRARQGLATLNELKHLADHGLFYPTTPKKWIKKPEKK